MKFGEMKVLVKLPGPTEETLGQQVLLKGKKEWIPEGQVMEICEPRISGPPQGYKDHLARGLPYHLKHLCQKGQWTEGMQTGRASGDPTHAKSC